MGTKRSIYDVLVEPTIEDIFSITHTGSLPDGEPLAFTGAEQGFNERADLLVAAADGTDLNEMWAEIQQTLAIRNSQRNRLIDYLTYNVTEIVDTVSVPSTADFEQASEYGQPVGIFGGKSYNRGYDFQFYDLAVRYTWLYIAEASRAQLESLNNMALEADNRLLFNRVMKTLFNPVNGVGQADSNIPVNVYRFYNADGEVPPAYKNNTFAGSHSHYLTSGANTVTSAALDTLEDDMIAHGYGQQSGTKLVLWVNRQEFKVIKSFRVTGGASYDFIPSENIGGGTYLPTNGGVVGRPNGGALPGEVGTYGPFHIVTEEYIPPGYIVLIAAGGPDSLTNPIGIRQHRNPTFRGLKLIPGQRSQYPLIDSFYQRGFGTGVRQRGAGLIMQITTSGTYTVPSAYA
jgi:hypothetical protein